MLVHEMRTELDLVEEYCSLNDAKVEDGGHLAPASEQRFRELQRFYDALLASRATRKVRASERFDVEEIRRRLSRRDRLRVPQAVELFFCHRDAYAPARMENLSGGGAFVSSDIALAPGSRLTLYMPNLGPGYHTLCETEADVVWTRTGMGTDGSSPARGMGACFRNLDDEALRQLDDYIIDYFHDRLSKGRAFAHRPSWVRQRSIGV